MSGAHSASSDASRSEVDGLACACGGRLVLHAVVEPPATIEVLESLERSANSRSARAPPTAA